MVASMANDLVKSYYTRFADDVLPPIIELWTRLEVPEWSTYRDALVACGRDVWYATQSSYRLIVLTFRPLLILTWIVGQFLFRNLLDHGARSVQKGAIQVKVASIWFYRFQRSLSWTEVLGEVTIIFICIAAYYFRKWLKRQTYWARAVRWYKGKKEQVVQSYTRAVHKVAQVSKIMAMALPHTLFLGLGIAFRVAFPAVVRWLAHDTYITAILSVYVPFFSTLGIVQGQRHLSKNKDISTSSGLTEEIQADMSSMVTVDKVPTKRKSQIMDTAAIGKRSNSKRQSATNRSVPVAYSRSNLTNTKRGSNFSSVPASEESSVTYWLRYWAVFSLVQAFGRFCYLVPFFGRIVTRHPMFYSIAAEVKLLFFVWLFGMERILGNTAKDAFLAEALPLRLIQRHLIPMVLELQSKVSEAIPPATWQRMVTSKVKSMLEMLVMVRFLSSAWKDWIVQVLDEARVLVLPSITLMMPGFFTQFGVAYVQFVVPSAKSSQARGESAKLLFLEYWVLHCLVAGGLTWFSSILWWIPFSTHCTFILWCYLVLPPTIREWYGLLESELVAFGLIKGTSPDAKMAIANTKTARLLHSLARRLPSGSDSNNVRPDEAVDEDENNDDRISGQVDDEESVTESVGPAKGTNNPTEEEEDDDSIPGLAAKTSYTQDESDNETSPPATTTAAAIDTYNDDPHRKKNN